MAPISPLTLKVTQVAGGHLHAIKNYIHERNPAAAARVGDAIKDAFELLMHRPLVGRPGHVPGTREKSVTRYPYVIVYEIMPEAPDTVVILGVFHTAQGDRKV